jgi:hypothetical protein
VMLYTFRQLGFAHVQQTHDCVALTPGGKAKQEQQRGV